MKSIDTNVLARLVLADDARQYEVALQVIEHPVWVSPTVWLELGWLLGTKLKRDRQVIANAMLVLLDLENVNTPDREGVHWAIERFRSGTDWADAMHLVTSVDVATTFATFDRGVAKTLGDEAPMPIETLA